MTNKEIKQICENMRKKHSNVNWGFKIKQDNKRIKIFWGYIEGEGNSHWSIHKKDEDNWNPVYNEHNEIMNEYLENDLTLTNAIESAVYYMVTRY